MKNSYTNLFQESMGKMFHTNNRTTKLHTSPHYTEEYFSEARCVFGNEDDVEHTAYDDRIRQWDWEKSEKSWDTALESKETVRSANFYEKYLQEYFDKPSLHLTCIWAGVNRSNGYPYVCFGWKEN